jgi:hypothetical protein
MPEDTGFETGSLAMRLNDLKIKSANGFKPTINNLSTKDGKARVSLAFSTANIHGSHTLEGKQVWLANIDGAGTGLSYDEDGKVRHAGGAGTNKNPLWIQTANDQRDRLIKQGGNGVTLVDTYTQHRDALNDVMTDIKGYPFQIKWGTPYITAMADDTHGNIGSPDSIINSSKTYGLKTYNEHSLLQQVSMISTLASFASHSGDKKKYNDASIATATFAASIVKNTQKENPQNVGNTPQLSVNKINDIVTTGTAAPQVSLEQVNDFMKGNKVGGKCADGTTWSMMLTEDQRAYVRDFEAQQEMHIERLAKAKPVVLTEGAMSAELETFFMHLEFDIATDGSLSLVDGRVELDGFELDLDDTSWPEAIAPLARQELAKARFIKSLLHDRVADALERELVSNTAKILTGALKQ